MEFDKKLLHDVLDFLRTLGDVPLPPGFDTLRATLLNRMQAAVSAGDNYIDMKPGKKIKNDNMKILANDNSDEEYVTPDQQPASPVSFLYPSPYKKPAYVKSKTIVSNNSSISEDISTKKSQDAVVSSPSRNTQATTVDAKDVDVAEEVEENEEDDEAKDGEKKESEETVDPFIEIYSHMSLIQAEAKSHIFGQLQKREKRFFFEVVRPFWAVLVGTHFLSYDNRSDSKPAQILSIKGCTCKQAASTQRNPKRLSESTFELCYEDDKCFQFIASTSKEMEQWIAAIRRWELKSRDQITVDQNLIELCRAATRVPEETTNLSGSTEFYEDIIITDIAQASSSPGKTSKKNTSARSPGSAGSAKQKSAPAAQEVKPKIDLPKTGSNVPPSLPKLIKRDLPPPPSPSNNDEDEMIYHIIDEPCSPQVSKNGNSVAKTAGNNSFTQNENFVEDGEELYDDILIVKREVQKIIEDKKMVKPETERNVTQENEETYDDVNEVKNEVENMKKIVHEAKESIELEKDKIISREQPKVPTRTSPMKCFFGRFRQKNESFANKEDSKKKLQSPQKSHKTSGTKTKIKSDKSSSVKQNDDRLNDHIIETDLSDYNSPPPPRPVHNGESVSNNIPGRNEEEEEAIYDDIANKNVGKIGSSIGQSSFKINNPNKVVRNLNEQFDGQIYQNQSVEEMAEDNDEHYQVPRSDADVIKSGNYTEEEDRDGNHDDDGDDDDHDDDDDDSEKIYDDVQIVTKKKLENEELVKKQIAKKENQSKYNRNDSAAPAIMAKPLDKYRQNKLNKFSLLVGDKSTVDKNCQNKFNVGKQISRVQKVVKSVENRQINNSSVADDDIYDDCQAKG